MLYSSFRPPMIIRKRVDLWCEYGSGRGACLRNSVFLVECCDIDFQPCKKSLMFITHVPHFCENGYVYLTIHANGHADMIGHIKMFVQYGVKLYSRERQRENRRALQFVSSQCLNAWVTTSVGILVKGPNHRFSNLCWRCSFHKMFNLGDDPSLDRWDWAKDLIRRFYIDEKIEIWVPKIQIDLYGLLQSYGSFIIIFLWNTYPSTNRYSLYNERIFGWDFMLNGIFIFNFTKFTCKKT